MKLGIVGTGMIAHLVGPNLAGWGYEIVAVAGTPQTMGEVEELADAWGVRGRYSDYRELVADPEVEAVYVAVPNFLHYAVSEAALDAGKDVICEKPLASGEDEAARIAELAKKRGRFLWEAMVTTRQPNYVALRRDLLPRIGDVKVVTVNYSQYSSRYDAFREGRVLPAFDPAKAGGAIMDLGIYTLSFVLGLFGEPLEARYAANIERGIDTSGVAYLRYDDFVATAICAKDCGAPSGALIQGTDGYILMDTPPNVCGKVVLHLNDGTQEVHDASHSLVWEGEFREFARQRRAGDFEACYRQLDQSVLVSRVQNEIRRAAGVIFPTDERN